MGSSKIKLFLLELGEGFTFIGNQYRVLSGTKEYFVEVEIALRDVNKPIGIAEYELHLPMKQIKELISEEINKK